MKAFKIGFTKGRLHFDNSTGSPQFGSMVVTFDGLTNNRGRDAYQH